MQPSIIHYQNDKPGVMEEGMVFTIEPILLMYPVGDKDVVMWPDHWTVQVPNNPSAQWEHMVLIGKGGAEVLTELK